MSTNRLLPRPRLLFAVAPVAGIALTLALAGCGSSGHAGANPASDPTSKAPASTGAGAPTTTSAGDTPTSVNGAAPTTFPSGPSTSGSSSDLTFKTICTFASAGEIGAATGTSGVSLDEIAPTSDDPTVVCHYNAPGAREPVAVLIYDPSQAVSYSQQPNDHGLHGFALAEPTQDDRDAIARMPTAQQAAFQSRLATTVTWVYKSHPIRFRFGGPTNDGNAKLIATAQLINSRLPA